MVADLDLRLAQVRRDAPRVRHIRRAADTGPSSAQPAAAGTRSGREPVVHRDFSAVPVHGGNGAGVSVRRAAPGPRHAGSAGQGAAPARTIPAWTPAQLGLVQAQLKRLGLYRDRVDRRFGQDTESALVEAFAGDEWRSLDPKDIIQRLVKAVPPEGRSGEHTLRYGELFKDGLLDITLGIGFDERGSGKSVFKAIQQRLAKEGFEQNAAEAVRIYKKTHNVPGASAFGLYFVRKTPLDYHAPAGSRSVDVVIRLVSDPDEKHGEGAAAAYKEGMEHSDVAFYAGHGRFGSGPDFDRAMKVTFLNPDGSTRKEVDDYEGVEPELASETKSRDVNVLWARFLRMVDQKEIKVEGENRGNIYLNKTDKHPGEFAARLMYWNLARKGAAGSRLATGPRGELARPLADRKFRLWVFNGCRTQDYVQSIRSTPGAGPRTTDIIATRRTIYWDNYVDTIVAFLHGIINRQSAEQIVKEMDATNVTDRPAGKAGVADVALGTADNPVIP